MKLHGEISNTKPGMNRIDELFQKLRAAKKKAFIAFITAGYPDLETTEGLIREFESIGVDLVELGVPFSDPIADGPVIQEASYEALKKNTTLPAILRMVKRVRADVSMPLCLMSYYNPIFTYGEKRFISDAVSSGVDGIIIPDLPPEEGVELSRESSRAGLDTIFFLSPTTHADRVKTVAQASTGFIYYISLTGVTGARRSLPRDIKTGVAEVKRFTHKPVCVGFGVSSPEQVKDIQGVADGVIVGSAIVRVIRENAGKKDLIKTVGKFVARLKG
ncbi:MAG: tryptophan synthase subunit alpha [Candidatus Omnitrophica bacterium]|nr:tryptophan synthase subunit alpha [Candidatus Omnitrophota bacterium]